MPAQAESPVVIPSTQLSLARADVLGLAQEYPAGGEALHAHAQFGQVLYVARGAATVRTPAACFVLPPQRALWIPAGMPHAFSNARPVSLRSVYVRQGAAAIPPWRQCTLLQVGPLLRELILALMAMPWDYVPGSHGNRLAVVLLDQLAPLRPGVFQLHYPSDARAARAATIARDDTGHRLTLGEIAVKAGASERTLDRLFAAETKMGFGAWRRCLRLSGALERLARGEAITAVAEAAGYVNPSSFIAAFKAAFGTTPARYFAARGAARPQAPLRSIPPPPPSRSII